MPVYYATESKWKAFGWALLSGLTEPIGGIAGYAILQVRRRGPSSFGVAKWRLQPSYRAVHAQQHPPSPSLQPFFTEMVFGIVFSMVGGMLVFIVCHELLPAAHRCTGACEQHRSSCADRCRPHQTQHLEFMHAPFVIDVRASACRYMGHQAKTTAWVVAGMAVMAASLVLFAL